MSEAFINVVGGAKTELVFPDYEKQSALYFNTYGEGYYSMIYGDTHSNLPNTDGEFVTEPSSYYPYTPTIIYDARGYHHDQDYCNFYSIVIKVLKSTQAGKYNVYFAPTGELLCSNCSYIKWPKNTLAATPIFIPI